MAQIITEAEAFAAFKTLMAFFGKDGATPVADAETEPTPAPKGRTRKAAAAKPEPEPEPEDEEEPEAEAEGGLYDPEELAGKTLRALKALAVEEGYDADDLKGYDKDDLITLLTTPEPGDEDEDGDDEGDEDEADEDEDAEDDEDGDDETITEDDLRAMSLAELKALAKEEGVPVKAGMGKDAIIDALLGEE